MVLPSEASQIVKQRLLNFTRSLSTVMALAYCLSRWVVFIITPKWVGSVFCPGNRFVYAYFSLIRKINEMTLMNENNGRRVLLTWLRKTQEVLIWSMILWPKSSGCWWVFRDISTICLREELKVHQGQKSKHQAELGNILINRAVLIPLEREEKRLL